MDYGMCRINQQDASGSGEIVNFTFTLDPFQTGLLRFEFTDITVLSADETIIPVSFANSGFMVLGINEPSGYSSVSVYPNPSTGLFNVSTEQLGANESQVRVYDVMGKVVYETTGKEN